MLTSIIILVLDNVRTCFATANKVVYWSNNCGVFCAISTVVIDLTEFTYDLAIATGLEFAGTINRFDDAKLDEYSQIS